MNNLSLWNISLFYLLACLLALHVPEFWRSIKKNLRLDIFNLPATYYFFFLLNRIVVNSHSANFFHSICSLHTKRFFRACKIYYDDLFRWILMTLLLTHVWANFFFLADMESNKKKENNNTKNSSRWILLSLLARGFLELQFKAQQVNLENESESSWKKLHSRTRLKKKARKTQHNGKSRCRRR